MTELEKIAYAKSFIDKLANGINPLDGQPIAENDIVNNVRLSRCFFYVSDILRRVIENGGTTPPKKTPKSAFSITLEQISGYSYSDTPITVSEIAKKINDLIDTNRFKRITYSQIAKWLLSVNALEEQTSADGKIRKCPTKFGRELGISALTKIGKNGEYQAVVYDKRAQAFIVENIEAILSLEG